MKDIKQKIKELDISRGKKAVLTQLLCEVGRQAVLTQLLYEVRMQIDEKIIYNHKRSGAH